MGSFHPNLLLIGAPPTYFDTYTPQVGKKKRKSRPHKE